MSGIPLLITAGLSGASESSLSLSDVTTGNTSTSKHGLAPKLSGLSTEFLNGLGAWSVPAGGGFTTQNVLWCVQGGSYATLQDAVNAASDRQTILVAPKGSSWGDVVLPAGKRINIFGLQSERGLIVEINSVTFSPTTGANILLNENSLFNLYINQTTGTSSAVTFGGTAPGRLRFMGCYINASNGSVPLIDISNSGSASSLYLERCNVDAGSSGTRTAFSLSSSVYFRVRNSDFSGGAKCGSVSAGTLDVSFSTLECNQVNEVLTLSGGLSFLGYCAVKNTTANGSGIAMSSPALLSFGASGFAVNDGTGYCMRGTGTVLYDRISFSHSALDPENVKIQNTLTLLTYTTTPSVVA